MIGATDLPAFVAAHLPAAPAEVLEIGCGSGQLALSIADLGHRIIALDPEAPDGTLFRRVSFEKFAERGPFDAVIASRALHHIPDLAGALDKIQRLLRPVGRLILNEHAWDRLDEPTARWYLERRALSKDADAPRSLERCLEDWHADHAGLHDYGAMRQELDHRFTERFFEWVPYLYGELGNPSDEQEERTLIQAGAIEATGFRYVGEPKAAT